MDTLAEHAHDDHKFLAHHFQSHEHQFDACKLGMWIFLVTEVLFFSGLFVAYAVYRSNHPEVFVYAHHYLNTTLGAFNTIVLLCSSLTMAWAVRCAQLNQRRGLMWCLGLTLACAGLFLGVKAVEYSTKWNEGLLWAGSFAPTEIHSWEAMVRPLTVLSSPALLALLISVPSTIFSRWRKSSVGQAVSYAVAATAASFLLGVAIGLGVTFPVGGHHGESASDHASDHASSHSETHPSPPAGEVASADSAAAGSLTAAAHASQDVSGESGTRRGTDNPSADATGEENAQSSKGASQSMPRGAGGEVVDSGAGESEVSDAPRLAGVFFSIYYAMTGVHAIHILAGMGVMLWLLWRSTRGDFSSEYYGPVDFVGLYWHLVDLVWIYLFPLLYLIN